MNKFAIAIAAAVLLSATGKSEASHFRGAAMVPEINSSGLLTVTVTTFWRKGATSVPFVTLSGAATGGMSTASNTVDTSDPRYDRRTTVFTRQLTSANTGTIDMTYSSCCRVDEGGVANWTESSWTMNSRIVYNGSATKPIDFSFGAIQPEVNRNGSYSDNLGAVSPDGLTLTYNQNLNDNINSQAPGFSINTTTGELTIAAGSPGAADYADHHQSQNAGADAAFSGNIIASNGSFVEFDWMFDGVDGATNTAPTVQNAATSATVGQTVSHTFTATDAEDTPSQLMWDNVLFAFIGATPAISPVWNGALQLFTWDTTGSAPGTYIAQVRVRDTGGLTDVGSLTMTLQASNVPEPASLALLAMGAGGLLLPRLRRRRKLGQDVSVA